MNDNNSIVDDSGFYEPYADFAKTLRTWFIAYGIGFPVLILSNDKCWEVIQRSGHAQCLAMCFLSGVLLQVTLALLYKSAMWQLYSGELNGAHKSSCIYKIADWFSDQFYIEFILDILTIMAFGYATVSVVMVITNTPQQGS